MKNIFLCRFHHRWRVQQFAVDWKQSSPFHSATTFCYKSASAQFTIVHWFVLFCYLVDESGSIRAMSENAAVQCLLLREIHEWKAEGASELDVITRLRQQTVPQGHNYHTWKPGKSPKKQTVM